MKFSKEHYEALKSAIVAKDLDLVESKKIYEAKGLSETRLLWDIFWASGYNMNESFRNSSYNDSHIETALRKAFSELTA